MLGFGYICLGPRAWMMTSGQGFRSVPDLPRILGGLENLESLNGGAIETYHISRGARLSRRIEETVKQRRADM